MPSPASSERKSESCAERGAVTAELAIALPVLVAVLAAMLWVLSAAGAYLSCVDAARVGARAAARGEPLPAVRAVVGELAPPGARVTVTRNETTVTVRVDAEVRPVGAAGPAPASMPVAAEATAAREDAPIAAPPDRSVRR